MRPQPTTLFLSLLVVLFAIGSTSCDLINPEEQIPSFIRIDSISPVLDGDTQVVHEIVDAWVYDNEKLVGVYEMPATVPILRDGQANIRIRPGVKLNGLAASRWKYEFLEDFSEDVELFEDSVISLNPILRYRENAVIPWSEDFSSSSVELTLSSISQGSLLFSNGVANLHLSAGESLFECKSTVSPDLPDAGASVILEFRYKCDHEFRISLISESSFSTVQTPVYLVSPSEDWNYLYINLSGAVSSLIGYNEHAPAFGFVRADGYENDINVYLDNIRLIHF